ncbi:MAG: hypothetical protein HZT43_15890 [Exiguobacterium profundum]|nr:MAG: hypothetical protein HZT43_15890 [Exiguobacterium profundum]
MNTDLMLTGGIVLLALTIPALLNAYSSSRPLALVSAILIVTALVKNPRAIRSRKFPM